jgi:diguanylate cyclase (GGDEF)-like protein/PAS domain S-box-containing protein
VLSVGRDVTERHVAEQRLAESEARFRDLADRSSDIVWHVVAEPTPHFDYMSPSVENILGYPPSFFLEDFNRVLDILDDNGRKAIDLALRGERPLSRMDLYLRHADGSIVIGETQTTNVDDAVQGVTRDVTELRHLQDRLAALALRDPLTGLANRRLLDELLDAELARTQRSGVALAVAYIDLDGLKQVNDTYGHDAGDVVLCEAARRLVAIVRGADVVARLGGDEFVIVYEPTDPNSDKLVDRIDAALGEPIEVASGVPVCCPASIGTADTRIVGWSATKLLAAADDAMYQVKRARRALRSV